MLSFILVWAVACLVVTVLNLMIFAGGDRGGKS